MPVVTLTEITIRSLKPVPSKQVTYLDKTLKGFGVRVTETGHKSFVLTYGEDRKRVKLGHVGIVPLAKARDKAKDILAERQLNGDAAQTLTFDEGLKLFLSLHCKQNNRESTAHETERLLTRHFLDALKEKKLGDLATADLMAIVDKLIEGGTPSEANHAFTAAKTFLSFCVARRYIEHSPLEGLKKASRNAGFSATVSALALMHAAPILWSFAHDGMSPQRSRWTQFANLSIVA